MLNSYALAADELIVDNFAGGGGASTGIEMALGRHIDIAINHDEKALAMHRVNHPFTLHVREDVWKVNIPGLLQGRRVGLAWFSPDCKHFSKAKGGAPVEKKIRGLAWIVLKWASAAQPRIIMLENVEEFQDWGPLISVRVRCKKTGRFMKAKVPCKKRKGMTFKRWKTQLENLGYVVEVRRLRACDYGAPTTRQRLFVIARRDGMPIVWPDHTHAPEGTMFFEPYRTAAECIDWAIPCPSIFDRKRPLKPNTMRRIAKGIERYVMDSADPFIVNITHSGSERVEPVHEPLRTVTGANRGEKAVIVPHLVGVGGRMGQSSPRPVDAPYHTTTAKADTALVSPVLVRTAHGERCKKGKKRGRGDHDPQAPLPTVTGSGDFALVTPFVTKFRSGSTGHRLDEPLHTITAGGDMKRPAGSPHAFGIVAPTLIQVGYGEKKGQKPRVPGLEKPLGTVVSGGGKHALVAAFLAQHNTERGKGVKAGRSAKKPFSTITSSGSHQQVVVSHMVKMRGTSNARPADEPLDTISAGGLHHAEVRAFLMKYYGTDQAPELNEPLDTVTTKDRFALVTIRGEQYAIVDIGMRMLTARELFRAQSFPENYIIDHGIVIHQDGDRQWVEEIKLTKTEQVKMCGNSVCPEQAAAVVRAQFGLKQNLNPQWSIAAH